MTTTDTPAATPRLWPIEPVADQGDVGRYCCLTLDAQGQPAVSYWGESSTSAGRLMLARRNGAAWSSEEIVRVHGSHSALAASGGSLWVVYYDLDEAAVRAAHGNGDGWEVETVADRLAGFTTAGLSMVVTSLGAPDVAYWTDGSLILAHRTPNGWTSEHVDDDLPLGVGSGPSIAGERGDHLCYLDVQGRALKYARRSEGTWEKQVVIAVDDANGGFSGEHVSMAVDESGRPHLGFWSDTGLVYSVLAADGWHFETVDVGDGVGRYPSLALDSAGRPVIAYQAVELGAVKMARRLDSWQIETVEASGGEGAYTSLALDHLDVPHIAFYDWDAGQLRYSRVSTPPVAGADRFVTFVNQSVSGNVLAGDTDPEGDPLVANVTPVVDPEQGWVLLEASGNFTYTPTEGFNGYDRFEYEVSDPTGLSDTAEVKIEVHIPTLVQAKIKDIDASNRGASRGRGKVTIRVDASRPRSIRAVLQRQSGSGPWSDTGHTDLLSRFKINPPRRDFGSGPFRLAFRAVRGREDGYTFAFSEEFQLPPARGKELMLSGSLQPSEPPAPGQAVETPGLQIGRSSTVGVDTVLGTDSDGSGSTF